MTETTMSEWAELRQVVLASTDPEPLIERLRGELRLGRSFGDPELASHGIADATFAIGADTYLEVVSPLTADHPIAAWAAKRGGSGGYLLSIQVSDVDACMARCAELGIRVTHTQLVQGHRVAQLHGGDMSATVELDGLAERGRWFWDALDVDRPAGARVDDVVAVDVAVADPDATAQLWATVIGVEAAGATIQLGNRTVRFVPRDGRGGIVGADLHAVDRTADPGTSFDAGGMRLRLV